MTGHHVEQVDASALIDLRHRVLRAGRPRQTAHLPGDDAPDTVHYRLVIDGRTAAIASVMVAPLPDGPTRQLRGMAVEPDLSRQGLGSELLRAVQEAHGALWCNARTSAVPFYEHHGFCTVSDVFEVPEVGPHVRMVWSG